MTCSGVGLQYFERPYLYDRRPLKLTVNEKIPFSGVLFSQPAYAVLTDLRLFTPPTGHPVDTPIKLYVNKVSGLTIPVEPSPTASGYTSGCVNYVDYITDIRDLLDDLYDLFATDSDHDANAFKISHLVRNRSTYGDFNMTSASGFVEDDDYVHAAPVKATPSGRELGASGMMDIDVDEIAYQAMTRLAGSEISTVANEPVPTSPLFPRVIKSDGAIPSFGPKDKEIYGALGLDVSSSGSLLLAIGDRLLTDTSIKIMAEGSGSAILASVAQNSHVDGALYPSKQEMCRYIETSGISGITPTITASGRQSFYDVPTLDQGVYLVVASEDTETSGVMVQHWPPNWETGSGVRSNGSGYHEGLYVDDKLIYALNEMTPGRGGKGRSRHNGRVVFGHVVGDETNSLGNGMGNVGNVYVDSNTTVYSLAGKVSRTPVVVGGNPAAGTQLTQYQHDESFAVADRTLSSVSFVTGSVDDQASTQQIALWREGTTDVGGNFGVFLNYAGFGYVDYFVVTDSPTSTPGPSLQQIIYEIRTFDENGVTSTGEIVWKERSTSPEIKTVPYLNYTKRWNMNGFYSIFLVRNGVKGMVNVNGKVWFQYGAQTGSTSRRGRNLTRPVGFFQTLNPPTNFKQVVSSIGFFPNWKLVLTITTNNQLTVNTDVNFSPQQIVVSSDFPHFSNNDVDEYGPPVWDEENNVNYLYVKLVSGGNPISRFWFCKMNTNFEIYEANVVDEEDVILFGSIGIISL